MRTYKLTIAYDGTNYQGWQRQSDTDRTIQGILKRRWKTAQDIRCRSTAPGEPMPEFMQAARLRALFLPGKVDTALFTEKMNGCLPPDIRILDVELVKNGFHARKSAVGKVYEYRIDTGIKARCIYTEVQRSFSGRIRILQG